MTDASKFCKNLRTDGPTPCYWPVCSCEYPDQPAIPNACVVFWVIGLVFVLTVVFAVFCS